MANPCIPNLDLDYMRKLVSTVAVCTDDQTHEVRCNDEELRNACEPIFALQEMYHRVVSEGLIVRIQLEDAKQRQAELEGRWAR